MLPLQPILKLSAAQAYTLFSPAGVTLPPPSSPHPQWAGGPAPWAPFFSVKQMGTSVSLSLPWEMGKLRSSCSMMSQLSGHQIGNKSQDCCFQLFFQPVYPIYSLQTHGDSQCTYLTIWLAVFTFLFPWDSRNCPRAQPWRDLPSITSSSSFLYLFPFLRPIKSQGHQPSRVLRKPNSKSRSQIIIPFPRSLFLYAWDRCPGEGTTWETYSREEQMWLALGNAG